MGVPVTIAGYRAVAAPADGQSCAPRPIAPLYRVEPAAPPAAPGPAESAFPWGPAAQLTLTPLGEAVLRADRSRLVLSSERLDRVRRLIAAEGCAPTVLERAVALLTGE
ncbi:MAG: hypothetical protein RMM58_14540 [Chloroflexota bacterium]|nr:hypothetical protein [Dehalococcoidia bacterium]MDW8255091.1 hypothetical protein [Chloroflexota bacterium]